jgi:hypothetical protein
VKRAATCRAATKLDYGSGVTWDARRTQCSLLPAGLSALAKEAAEKFGFETVLKVAPLGAMYKPLYSCHSEWASAHEESAFSGFSASSKAVGRDDTALFDLRSSGPLVVFVPNARFPHHNG